MGLFFSYGRPSKLRASACTNSYICILIKILTSSWDNISTYCNIFCSYRLPRYKWRRQFISRRVHLAWRKGAKNLLPICSLDRAKAKEIKRPIAEVIARIKFDTVGVEGVRREVR